MRFFLFFSFFCIVTPYSQLTNKINILTSVFKGSFVNIYAFSQVHFLNFSHHYSSEIKFDHYTFYRKIYSAACKKLLHGYFINTDCFDITLLEKNAVKKHREAHTYTKQLPSAVPSYVCCGHRMKR